MPSTAGDEQHVKAVAQAPNQETPADRMPPANSGRRGRLTTSEFVIAKAAKVRRQPS